MDSYGPPLPPGYIRPDDSDEEDMDESNLSSASKQVEETPKVIGPQCPDFISRKELSELYMEDTSEINNVEPISLIGPALPASLQVKTGDGNSGDELYGPVPSQSNDGTSDISETKAAIEKRAENMRNKLDNKHIPSVDIMEREEWMTVPDDRKNQLGAISRCLAPTSKSSSSKERRSHHHSEKDRKTSEELKKYNKSKRSESLMDLHKKDKKKKEKEKEKKAKKERKAFDRDEIAVKEFSKDQVNSVVDKAKYLNTRFSAGNKQYL